MVEEREVVVDAGRIEKKDLAMRAWRSAVIVVFSARQAERRRETVCGGKVTVRRHVLRPLGGR